MVEAAVERAHFRAAIGFANVEAAAADFGNGNLAIEVAAKCGFLGAA